MRRCYVAGRVCGCLDVWSLPLIDSQSREEVYGIHHLHDRRSLHSGVLQVDNLSILTNANGDRSTLSIRLYDSSTQNLENHLNTHIVTRVGDKSAMFLTLERSWTIDFDINTILSPKRFAFTNEQLYVAESFSIPSRPLTKTAQWSHVSHLKSLANRYGVHSPSDLLLPSYRPIKINLFGFNSPKQAMDEKRALHSPKLQSTYHHQSPQTAHIDSTHLSSPASPMHIYRHLTPPMALPGVMSKIGPGPPTQSVEDYLRSLTGVGEYWYAPEVTSPRVSSSKKNGNRADHHSRQRKSERSEMSEEDMIGSEEWNEMSEEDRVGSEEWGEMSEEWSEVRGGLR
eukprot:GHVN01099605.1.p1 GENE.GHVN01099605.1~~GHVN01099605.1.p1  ORF type:complete len:341 (-),score=85.57 GHVN01099605.1:50-1072(-)